MEVVNQVKLKTKNQDHLWIAIQDVVELVMGIAQTPAQVLVKVYAGGGVIIHAMALVLISARVVARAIAAVVLETNYWEVHHTIAKVKPRTPIYFINPFLDKLVVLSKVM
jgi:hypothetical protein